MATVCINRPASTPTSRRSSLCSTLSTSLVADCAGLIMNSGSMVQLPLATTPPTVATERTKGSGGIEPGGCASVDEPPLPAEPVASDLVLVYPISTASATYAPTSPVITAHHSFSSPTILSSSASTSTSPVSSTSSFTFPSSSSSPCLCSSSVSSASNSPTPIVWSPSVTSCRHSHSRTTSGGTVLTDEELPGEESHLPPSVVISDHSLDEVVVIHHHLHHDHYSTDQQFPFYINGNSSGGEEVFSNDVRRDSLSSICSSTSSLSSLGEDLDDIYFDAINSTTSLNATRTSPWRKVRSLVTSPFIQTYKRQKYPWIQLAGHQGNFLAGQIQGTILKKKSGNEDKCFKAIMEDELRHFVPHFKSLVHTNGETYIELEDLLAKFNNPSIMDIKMGVRTYLEEELIKAGEKPKLRKDMYEKMVAIDPSEPTPEEHAMRAVTKPRYMIWRESISSTSTLGFRIDGVKLRSGTDNSRTNKDFKRTKTEDSVRSAILQFAEDKAECIEKYLAKLKLIRATLESSQFFASHEVIGSSLLFVHDDTHADIWLIDFAKTCPLPAGVKVNHRDAWQLGNHEDGYLTGLDNLIRLFSDLTL